MSRGLGRTERLILEYLDEKAKRGTVTQVKTIAAYANTSEIAENLQIKQDSVCQAINALGRSGRVRIYPNGRKRDRYFGSLILPSIGKEEMSSIFQTILSTNNRKEIGSY